MDENSPAVSGRPTDWPPTDAHQVMEGCIRILAAGMDGPHIVICRDLCTGATSYEGPYDDGLAAVLAADREAAWDRAHDTRSQMEYSVAPLLVGLDVC
ncbi:MAG: hypothetical protein J7518_17140 [Nocardioidaceae bacterium]|nr:hypothetical protein [Nocardioidaceae bacterium]